MLIQKCINILSCIFNTAGGANEPQTTHPNRWLALLQHRDVPVNELTIETNDEHDGNAHSTETQLRSVPAGEPGLTKL